MATKSIPTKRALALAGVLALSLPSVVAGEPTGREAPSAGGTNPAEDGRIVLHVVVPLCDNAQIDCGSRRAGDPVDLAQNLYWGAIFGQKRFFGRKASTFAALGARRFDGPVLERAAFSRRVPGTPFHRTEPVELVVVLDAYRGDAIDAAVDAFFIEAERGGAVVVPGLEDEGPVTVDVVGFAGHNRMMDGKRPPALAEPGSSAAIPSFVLACRSAAYFAGPLAERGSVPLVLTRDLMAPEGYVVEAVALGVAAGGPRADVRRRAVDAYAKWQGLDARTAGSIFAKLD